MRLRSLIALLSAAALVAACSELDPPPGTVASVPDGDTLRLVGGQRVRLVQIDAPEARDCYAGRARDELRRLAPIGSRVELERDARLDDVDRFGRVLRYVLRDDVNVNLELVRRGAAVPFFFGGERGRLADEIEGAAGAARAAGRGLWSCPGRR